jgi:hypothetical protein
MADEEDDTRRASSRRYWLMLLGWYSFAAALAVANGRFAHSPWKVSLFLFGAFELATIFAAMFEDDWGNDFRGDREIFVRGTLANAAVVAAFTAVGVALPGSRL